MRFAGFLRRRFGAFVATALGLAGAACSGANPSAPYSGDPGMASPDASETQPNCTPFPCGAQCCQGNTCWFVDSTGATVQEVPACSGPEAGPPVGPATLFAGRWSPISGSGQESCTDGEATALPPDTSAVLTFVQSGLSTLEAFGAGSASTCSMELRVAGNVASEASPNPGCAIPGSNGVIVYFPKFQITLDEPDGGTEGGKTEGGTADGGEDGGSVRPQVTLTWQLESTFTDAVKTCTSSLVYTLAPAP